MTIKQQHAELTARAEELRLGMEVQELEQAVSAMEHAARYVPLQEAWGDPVDRREYLYDTPGFNRANEDEYVPQFDDRMNGKFLPFFENETDLAFMRGMGIVIANGFPSGHNIQENLNTYTIGEGFQYEAVPVEEGDLLAEQCQRVIDDFLDRNDWVADMEGEVHDLTREHGEVLLWLHAKGWRTDAECMEPEQLTEPLTVRDLEDWASWEHHGGRQFVSDWSFGVHTEKRRPAKPLGYHVIHDAMGNDWDYIPESRAEHIKRNVSKKVKRGISDYYPVKPFLDRAQQLLDNMGYGAAMQSAIAWIVEHAAGVTQSAASGLVTSNASRTVTYNEPNGQRNVKQEKIRKGRVIHTPNGRKFQHGPLGQNNAPNFVLVEQALLRYGGIRWSMPEYMISGDASNANYSSTLVAESPFVKSRERDQRFYASRYRNIIWKVLRIAWEGGYFRGAKWGEIEARVDVKVNPPPVATRNRLEMAQENQIMVALGARSVQTAAEQMGDDWEQEQERGVSIQQTAPSEAGGEFGQLGRRQFTNNTKAIDDILSSLVDGRRTEAAALQMLGSLGLSQERSQSLIDDVATPESYTSVLESLSKWYP